MTPAPPPVTIKRHIWEAAAIILGGLTLFMILRRLDGAQGLLLASGEPMFGDFLAFWTGGRHAFLGDLANLYNEKANAALQQAVIPNLSVTVPFYSPPLFLLLMAPLAALDYQSAAIVFLLLSFGLYAAACWRLAPDRRTFLFAATMPVALLHLTSLQLDILIVGLAGLALSVLDRRPLLAGFLIACLAIKPHLALLWPVMLAVQMRWRAFAAATLALAALTLLTLALFGPGVFSAFLHNLPVAQSAIDLGRVGAHTVGSLYGTLYLAGASKTLAMAAHAVSALGALCVAVLIWRRANTCVSGAALCAATYLISPYMFFYDLPLLGLAALLLAGAAATLRGQIVLALGWSAGLATLVVNSFIPAPVGPLVAWLLLALAWRMSAETKAAAPAIDSAIAGGQTSSSA